MALPNDPMILLSYINTQLRDTASSLEEFCKSNDCDMQKILKKLADIGYHYDKNQNRFK